MNLEFNCPHCNRLLAIDEKWRSTEIKCPDCGGSLIPGEVTARSRIAERVETKEGTRLRGDEGQRGEIKQRMRIGMMLSFLIAGLSVLVLFIVLFAYRGRKVVNKTMVYESREEITQEVGQTSPKVSPTPAQLKAFEDFVSRHSPDLGAVLSILEGRSGPSYMVIDFYDIVLSTVGVKEPRRAERKYGSEGIAALGKNLYMYEDKLINIILFPSSEGIHFSLGNKGKAPLRIIWDEARYIDVKGIPHRIVHDGTRRISANRPQRPSEVISGSTLEATAYRGDCWSGLILPSVSKNLGLFSHLAVRDKREVECFKREIESFKGKEIGMVLLVKVGEVLEQSGVLYTFTFKIKDVELIGYKDFKERCAYAEEKFEISVVNSEHIVYDIINNGDKRLTELSLTIHFLDGSGKDVSTASFQPIRYLGGPPLEPHSRRRLEHTSSGGKGVVEIRFEIRNIRY